MSNCKICTNHTWQSEYSFCELKKEPVDLFQSEKIASDCNGYEEENSDFLIMDEMEEVNNE
jgi:hypothetical protein